MKKITGLILSLCTLGAPAQNAGQDIPTVYGSVIFGLKWEQMEEPPYGIYSVSPTDGAAISPVITDARLKANGGGVYADGIYYLVSYANEANGTSATLRAYDVEAGWKLIREVSGLGAGSVANDLAYDPVSDVIYGVFWSHDETYALGTLNPLTGESTAIAELSDPLVTLAADRYGNLFGIGEYGALYKVNKQSAALTQIGSTGKTIRYAQSATFDYSSGRLIWAMTPHDFSKEVELCEVDTLTGAATTLTTVPNRYELTGIFTKSAFTPGDAPARPQDLSFNYPQGSLSGSFSFAMPSTTFAGATLAGEGLSYTVQLDEQPLAENVEATPSEKISFSPTLEDGQHLLRVWATNGAGRSPLLKSYFWAGNDKPQALSPTATADAQGNVSLAWGAPEVGVHGGYFDASQLNYKVVREPDGEMVYEGTATSCQDPTSADLPYGYYYYVVTAYVGTQAGEPAQTAQLTIGEAAELPYSQSFDDEDAISTLSIIDANGDDNSWQYFGGSMVYAYSEAGYDAQDWLVTPPFKLSSDYVYQLSFDARADEGYTEQLSAAWGENLSAEGLPHEIIPLTQVTNTQYQTFKATFRPSVSGPAYVGVQALSTYQDGSFLYLDNLAVEELAPITAPDSVTALKAVADPQGERIVTLTFTVPTRRINGETLSALVTIQAVREADQRIIATLQNCEPGKEYTVSDTPTADGEVAYTLTAALDSEYGMPATVRAYVGEDVPGEVDDLQFEATDDGQVSLSWKAPSRGQHGGYVNPDGLTYIVTDLGSGSTQATVVSQPAFSSQISLAEGKQSLAWYGVTAVSSKGSGTQTLTDTLFVGQPYALPLEESFSNRSYDCPPWRMANTSLAEWMLLQTGTFASPVDADGGLLAFSTITEGASAQLESAKFDLTPTTNPRFTFSLWHTASCHSTLQVMLRDAQGTLYPLATLHPADDATKGESVEGEWREHSFNLKQYRNLSSAQLVFSATGGTLSDEGWAVPLYIDKVSIEDLKNCDLAVGTLGCDNDHVEVGESVSFTVTCTNKGASEASDYSLILLQGGAEVARTQGTSLAAGATRTFSIAHTPNGDAPETSLYAVIVDWEDDSDPLNNTSDTLVVTVLPGKPYVEAVAGERSGDNVILSWQQPEGIEKGTVAENVTESFESYQPFTISHFGQWELIDGDKQNTLGIQDGTGYFVEYPNVESPMAYMVFNPSEAGLSSLYFNAHSGSQVAATFSAGRYTANDDWLISPEVDGAQTITFWACSPDASYYGTQESLEVLYSTEDAERENFTKLGSTLKIPGKWTKYEQTLPDGTRYFALRCVSLDQYILFLDDITYRKAARDFQLMGYNVYRDGELLNASPMEATAYTDVAAGNETHRYEVTAVYNTGESAASPALLYDPTGIAAPTQSAQWSASIEGRQLLVKAHAEECVQVFNAAGQLIHTSHGTFTLTLPHGVYIVKAAGEARKIAI